MTKSKSAKPTKKSSQRTDCHQGPFRVAACWPHQEAPLLLVMLGEDKVFLATSMTPISVEGLMDIKLRDLADPSCDPDQSGDLPRWLVAFPYETFDPESQLSVKERPVAWSVKAGLVWNSGKNEPRYLARPDAPSARFHLDPGRELKSLLSDAQRWLPPNPQAIELLPVTSDDSYLENARSIISSIRDGDFYQVNLLRFFQAPKAGGWENLCMRMEKFAGPYGCILTQGSRIIASFSPERFIDVIPDKNCTKIKTWPIKGTSRRIPEDPIADEASGKRLLESEKDLAELRMIIDLMRNDLTRICSPGSVEVLTSSNLKKFASIWHLEGALQGEVRSDLSLRQLLEPLCPGGSITGAPKIAAMKRIKSDEGLPRGFFMGNLFTLMHDGSIRSNILIRTLLSDNWMRTARYAAGSGLVIKSDPEMELEEIKSKCTVITATHP